MAVNTTHPQYTEHLTQWVRCRAVIAGGDAVRAGGVAYLPALDGQDAGQYKAYQNRAGFFSATARTLDGLTGMIFRKDAEFTAPEPIDAYLDDVTLSGISFASFAERFVDELLQVGRVGALVDYPQVDNAPQNLAEQLANNIRPYLAIYPTESIVNWKTRSINNKQALSLMVLKEAIAEQGNDEFEHNTKTQYRVLDIDLDGFYRVRLFNSDNEFLNEFYPLINGAKSREIPFVLANVLGEGADITKPPLLDLADANLEHYRMMADYRHGLHFTALPTPVVTGHTLETDEQGKVKDTLSIGSTTAWVFNDPQASAFFLEFSGAGLGALESAIARQENAMALLGARIIASDKKATETAQTAEIHRAGEASVLSSIANSASRCLTRILQLMAQWDGARGECLVKLNTDFIGAYVTPQELTALLGLYQAGAISNETLFYNLKYGEIIESGVSFEDEQARIDTANIPAPQGVNNAQTNP